MSEENLEEAKANLIIEFPDAEERINAVKSLDKLTALEAELNKPLTSKEMFLKELKEAEGDPVKIDEAKKRYWKREWEEENEANAKKLIEKHEERKQEREMNKLPARLDALTQELETEKDKNKALEARIIKMEEQTDIKAHGLPQGPAEEEPSYIETAMATDTISRPMALNKLATELTKPEEGSEE